MKRPLFVFVALLPALIYAQVKPNGSFMGDETVFYAQTKQVNQFILRFNGEEDFQGRRYYKKDSTYRDHKSRKKYLNILFDNSNLSIPQDLKDAFILQVNSKKNPVFLDFHGKDWFAEVAASFTYKKEIVNIILYLKLEKQNSGYKWVFSNVYFVKFDNYFSHVKDTSNTKLFLHPLSHEIDFMNFHKVFADQENIDYYLESRYVPDQLALFVAELKNGNLKFESVKTVKFHFFQVPGWYFELSFFNRNSLNSGWLISNLIRINENDKKAIIRNYTHEN